MISVLLSIAGGQIATLIENIRLYEKIMESEEIIGQWGGERAGWGGVIGDDYRIRYVNEGLAEVTGYPREELAGMDFRRLLDEESQQLVSERYVRRQRGEEIPSRYEFNLLRKDGR